MTALANMRISSFSSCAEFTMPLGGTTSGVSGTQTVVELLISPVASAAFSKALLPAVMAALIDFMS